jgi:hypothetical protein
MKFIITSFLLCVISIDLHSLEKIPRQKIELKGLIKTGKQKILSVSDIEKLKYQFDFDLNDPYSNNTKSHFHTISMTQFFEDFAAKDSTKVKVSAIDGYQVEITKDTIIKKSLYIAYKNDKGYLGVDNMGPVRIIEKMTGVVPENYLNTYGVNWVWQIKTLEFKK